jgi:arylsulfatase
LAKQLEEEKNMNFWKIGSVTLLLLAIVLAGTAAAQGKPNIVFMMADNLGYGDVGVYGGGELRGAPTPRIDCVVPRRLESTVLPEKGCD